MLPILRSLHNKGFPLAETANISGWATYLRVSDEDKQTPERSFAMQRQHIQDHLINGSDIPFRTEYRDMLTGTTPNRADYQKLMADAEAGKFSHLGLYRADRFGRDTVEGLQAATKLIGWGIKIRVAHMPSLMPETPDGFFMFLLQMGMAQREVDVLRQRTSDGMEIKLRAGGWPLKAPEGYINKERLVSSNKYDRWVEQDPAAIHMVREAFDLLLTDRYTLVGICEELAARGYTRSNGLPWVWNDSKTGKRMAAKTRLNWIFHNPFYAGWASSEKFGIKVGEVRGIWEPIITHAEFQRGIDILKKHDLDKSRDRRHFYLLKGLLWMRTDGKTYKMAGSSPKTHLRMYAYYTTQSKPGGKDIHVQCADVDQQIRGWLAGIGVSQNRLPAIREEYRMQITKFKDKDLEVQTKKIQVQLSELKNEEARLGRLFITGKISEEAYNQLRVEWQDNIRNTEARLIEAERNISAVMVDLDMALVLLAKVNILYERLDNKNKARLLKILAKRIIIDPDGQIIDYELNSPFTYLRYLDEGLNTLQSYPVLDSEQVRLGAQAGFFI
jgi:DNA invertase Pin-like site-specific DNA recombinase